MYISYGGMHNFKFNIKFFHFIPLIDALNFQIILTDELPLRKIKFYKILKLTSLISVLLINCAAYLKYTILLHFSEMFCSNL